MQFSFKTRDLPLALRTQEEKPTTDEGSLPAKPSDRACSLVTLPVEIRQQIWLYVLRPDCASPRSYVCVKVHRHPKTFLGCTRILQVCSQIYHEAIELLHVDEKKIFLDGKYKNLLRQPLEFGKPSYFESLRATTKCYIPRQYDELQVVRMRKVHLDISFPDVIAFHRRNFFDSVLDSERDKVCKLPLAATTRNIGEIAKALAKSTNLTSLRITLDRKTHDWSFVNASGGSSPVVDHPDMLDRLKVLVNVAANLRCSLVVESQDGPDNDAMPEEPLAADLVNMALSSKVNARLVLTPRPPPEEPFGTGWANAVTATEDTPSPDDSNAEADASFDLEPPNTVSADAPTILEADLKLARPTTVPYSLVPECRTCHALFSAWPALQAHLAKTPRHRRAFKPKTFNKLDKYASSEVGYRKCWTCAREFSTMDGWTRHAEEGGHGRKGIVPKYKEDNWRWDRRWRGHEGRCGWL